MNDDIVRKALKDIVTVFYNTKPRENNKEEWTEIRLHSEALLLAWDSLSEEDIINRILDILKTITPLGDNKEEWGKLREACMQIRESNFSTKKKTGQLIFYLFGTSPRRDNIQEWKKIHDTVEKYIKSFT